MCEKEIYTYDIPEILNNYPQMLMIIVPVLLFLCQYPKRKLSVSIEYP